MNTFGTHTSNVNKAEIARYGGEEGCIYKYDACNDIWQKLKKYESAEFRALNHGMAIYHKKNQLFLFGGVQPIFANFDLLSQHGKSDIFDVSKHNEMNFWYPTSIFVGHELHILTEILVDSSTHQRRSLHCIYYPKKKQIDRHFITDANSEYIYLNAEQKENASVPMMYACKVVYVEHLKEILLFNGTDGNTHVWSYSMISNMWKLFELNGQCLMLPKRHCNNFDVTCVHDRIVLICYNEQKEIWAVDLKAPRNERRSRWTKRNVKQLDGVNDDCSMVNRENEYIHFMNTVSPSHYCVWFYHLLPKRILKQVYGPMVIGHLMRSNSAKMDLFGLRDKRNKEWPHGIMRVIADYAYNSLFN